MSCSQALARRAGDCGGVLREGAADVGHLGLHGLEVAFNGSSGGGAEILTPGLPKEVDELLALIKR